MEELTKIAFFLGVITTTLVVLIFVAWIQFKTDSDNGIMQSFFSSFQIYRVVFCFQLVLWYLIISRRVLQIKHLNFAFVMNIRPSNMGDLQSLIKAQIYSTLFFVLALLLNLVFIAETKSSNFTISASNLTTLGLFIIFCVSILTPSKTYLLDLKYAISRLLLECLGAPFTRVAFIHIILADCLTSFNKVILDLANSLCWTYGYGWAGTNQDATSGSQDCNFNKFWTIIILAAPFYIRFMQCLKRYYVTKLVFPNLYNALKYSLSIATIVLGNLGLTESSSLIVPFIVIGTTSYFYNNYWDMYNDWGLLRTWKGRRKFLRNKLTFPPEYYYGLIILNFILRLNWMGTLLSRQAIQSIFKDANLYILISEALEITRRWLWAIIRVEHELFSNFESLRDFWTVPSILYIKNKRNKDKDAIEEEDD